MTPIAALLIILMDDGRRLVKRGEGSRTNNLALYANRDGRL